MRKLLALSLIAVMFATGCTTAWLSTFNGYLKIAGPVLLQILDIVALAKHQAPDPALQAKILADQAALNKLAASVDVALQADLPNTCAKFNQAVSTFAGDLDAIIQLANIGQNTSGEIIAAVGIAQATIQEIEAPIAACQAAPNAKVAQARLQAEMVKVKSPEDVVRRFNAVVDSKHRVHLHSAPVRWLTLGKLQ